MRNGTSSRQRVLLLAVLAALPGPGPRAQCAPPGAEVKLTASDATPDGRFGEPLAMDDKTLLAGFVDSKAEVHVFVGAGGAWSEQAILRPSDPVEVANLVSCDISDDTVIAGGAPVCDCFSSAGAACVFVRQAGAWTEQAVLHASDGVPGDLFGYDVAIDGDTAVVSSLFQDSGGTDAGAAYVFVRSGAAWTQQAKLVPSVAGALMHFGGDVDISGDTIVVGQVPYEDRPAARGDVFVFVRTGTTWAEQAHLQAPDGGAQDRFGLSVSLDGDTIAVGADQHDHGGVMEGSGAVYVFTRCSNAWSLQAELFAGRPAEWAEFGWDVALDGPLLVTGTLYTPTFDGSAYVFERVGTGWRQQTELRASDGVPNDWFGYAVALSGDAVATGAIYEGRELSPGGYGAAYVHCASIPPVEMNCTNGTDDDGDGAADVADADCASSAPCPESLCADGTDNDADTLVDCADPSCATSTDCTPSDPDGDGVLNAIDCAPSDASAFAVPAEVTNLLTSHAGGSTVSTLAWNDLILQCGNGRTYDIATGVISELRADRGFNRAQCLAMEIPELTLPDASRLRGDHDGFWYLVRARNACGVGTFEAPSLDAQWTCD